MSIGSCGKDFRDICFSNSTKTLLYNVARVFSLRKLAGDCSALKASVAELLPSVFAESHEFRESRAAMTVYDSRT